MPSPAIATVVKMLESLPEAVQDHVAEHLREYRADLQDELQSGTRSVRKNTTATRRGGSPGQTRHRARAGDAAGL